MARARNIKPGFYQNDTLAECSIWARFIFPGLWMLADRKGRLEDRPVKIKAMILPFDSQNTDRLLTELHNRGFIYRYIVGRAKYIQILNFHKHQNPHCKEPESTIPDPPLECFDHYEAPDEYQNGTMQEQCLHSSGPADPGFRIPDPPSLIPDPPSPLPDSPTPVAPDEDGFAAFWSAWPKKVARAAAVRAWKKLNPGLDLQHTILTDVATRSQSDQWQKESGQFIPHPSTYLAGRRWEDELPPVKDEQARKAFAEFLGRGDAK